MKKSIKNLMLQKGYKVTNKEEYPKNNSITRMVLGLNKNEVGYFTDKEMIVKFNLDF